MRRYIFSGTVSAENTESYDVCIVGSGIAGLYAAIHIDPSMRTAVITKGMIDRSNSWLAQGGIASVISPDDYYASHIDDTLKAGAGLCDKKAVELLVEQGPDDIRELIDLDVPFDRNPEGELQITREGGHSRRRIVHCCGDATGRETTRRLGEIALERKHINIMFNTYVVDVVSDDSGIIGLIVFDDKPRFIRCSNIIVASGGVGHLYLSTTNPDGAIGDGIAMSQRAGAEIFGMELVQFHPTTLCVGRDVERAFLISEAVRGEGGILKNNRGEAFMQGVHPLADLAPRDIVTRAIIKEMNRIGDDRVYLDASSMSDDFFSHRFPTIYEECHRRGVAVPGAMIPVRPAQHYLMGGIRTNLDGMSNIDGLYSCGESASTGIHGANRLASNSMLECLVFGRRSAEHINANYRPIKDVGGSVELDDSGTRRMSHAEINAAKEALRVIVSRYAGPVRTPDGMAEGKKLIDRLYEEADSLIMTETYEFEYYNMVQSASMIINGAIARKESIGAHYVVDEM